MPTMRSGATNVSGEDADGNLSTALLGLATAQRESDSAAQKRHEELLSALTQTIGALTATQSTSGTAGLPATGSTATGTQFTQFLPQSRKLELNKPPVLEADISLERLDTWAAIWSDFSDASQTSGLPVAQRIAHFRSFMSPDMTNELTYGVGVPEDTQMEPKDIIQKIREYLRAKRNIAVDRLNFEKRDQKEGESFNAYLIDVKRIAANADLCKHCYDERLASRLIVGISDSDTRKDLLAEKSFPTLDHVVSKCRSAESAQINDKALTGGEIERNVQKPSRESQDARHARGRGRSKSRNKWQPGQKAPRNDKSSGEMRCSFCGRVHNNDPCPAKRRVCGRCGRKDHFARMCTSSDPRKGRGAHFEEKQIKSVMIRQSSGSRSEVAAPQIAVDVHGGIVGNWIGSARATPDTGAEGTVMGTDVMEQLGIDPDNTLPIEGDTALYAANGELLECIGWATMSIKFRGRMATDRVFFSPDHKGFLLPWYLMKHLHILPQSHPEPLLIGAVQAAEPPGEPSKGSRPGMQEVLGVLPTEPSEEQLTEIKKKVLEAFSDVFDTGTELKLMNSPPLKIELRKGAVPFSVRVPRQVPYAWREKVKAELDKMVGMRIIGPVEGEPTEWCHPLVSVPKPNNEVRICVDLTKLNPHVVRPLHPLKTPKEAVSNISNTARYFTVCDATKGYWQLALDESSQEYTTFITPWGRFKFLRSPMGLVSTGDEFCRAGDEGLADVEQLEKVVDDFILYDDDFLSHIGHVWRCLEKCREKSITLNPKKLQFAQKQVDFVGYKVSESGNAVDPKKLKAIKELKSPASLTELRSFFGLINQLTDFIPVLSAKAEPLRDLLRKKNAFVWTLEHEKAFQAVKDGLIEMPILAHFDPGLETTLETDASRTNGLGFVLRQKHGDKWRIIECGSRFVSPTEARYAMVELELLGVVWATSKCNVYLRGLEEYRVIVDHKPLVPILNRQTMADVTNPRILRLKEKLAGYVFKAEWRSGKDHVLPDALSRSPVDDPTTEDLEFEAEMRLNVVQVLAVQMQAVEQGHYSDPLLESLRKQGQKDADYQTLKEAVTKGFPSKDKCPPVLAPYWKLKDQLGVEEDLVVLDTKIVIPKSARREVLAKLHAAHQGSTRMKRRARESVFWPGISSDIENTTSSCEKCQESSPSQSKEPLVRDDLPNWVFEEVGCDLFQYGNNHYLVYVDRLSGWPVLTAYYNHSPTSREVIASMRKSFADLGVPLKLRSDNGPQFSSREFKDFLTEWGVVHCPSSPHYPQSNGLAESTVKSMKALVSKTTTSGRLDKDDAFWRALLEFRNTPKENGLSPAEFLYGCEMRSIIPLHKRKFAPRWQKDIDLATGNQKRINDRKDQHYNRGATPLSPLKVGQKVQVQDARTKRWLSEGKVLRPGTHRSYQIQMQSGGIYWRNRKFLRPQKNVQFAQESG